MRQNSQKHVYAKVNSLEFENACFCDWFLFIIMVVLSSEWSLPGLSMVCAKTFQQKVAAKVNSLELENACFGDWFSFFIMVVLSSEWSLPGLPIACAKSFCQKVSAKEKRLKFEEPCFCERSFIILAYVLSEVAYDIEVSERQRACNLAGAMLQTARIIGRRRYRAARASTCLSCLRDSILICAHRARLSSLVGDLSVVRRDVVRAGCVASKRAHCNFNILQRLLRRHHANNLILSEKDGTVVQHVLGDSVGRCIGNIYILGRQHSTRVSNANGSVFF